MTTPLARLIASLAMLALFYRAMLVPQAAPIADQVRVADADADQTIAASRDLYAAARYADALAPTEALVQRFPTQHVYWQRLANIYQQLGRFHDEAAAWQHVIERSPTPWDACPAIAVAHAAGHDAAAAFAAYESCWALAPWDADAAFFLAREHERRSTPEQAAALYRRSLAIDPSHADSQLGLARLDLHASRFDAARQAAQTMVARFPDHADAHLILAQAAQRAGGADEARQHFQQTLQLEERYFDAHLGLGILEFGEHNAARARQHFERALALDPSRRAELATWLDRTEAAR